MPGISIVNARGLTQQVRRKKKPMGKKKPKKNGKKKRKGLTAKQKKLPPALQKAILKKQRGGR